MIQRERERERVNVEQSLRGTHFAPWFIYMNHMYMNHTINNRKKATHNDLDAEDGGKRTCSCSTIVPWAFELLSSSNLEFLT